jgi:hypothetical protein
VRRDQRSHQGVFLPLTPHLRSKLRGAAQIFAICRHSFALVGPSTPIGGRLLRCDHVYHGIPTRWSRKEPTDDRQADGLIMADEIKLPRNMTRIEIDRELRHLETIDHGRDIARYQALRQALAEKLTKNAISMHCDRKIKTISRVTNLMRQKMAADAAERLEEQQRIRAGWQCPECYGRARIQARTSPFQPNNGFLCRMRMPMAQPMTREPTFRWVCSYQGCVDCLRTIEIGRFRWAGETR